MLIREFPGVVASKFDSTGVLVLAGQRLRRWDPASEQFSLDCPLGEPETVAFSPGATRVATQALGGPVQIWDTQTGAMQSQMECPPATFAFVDHQRLVRVADRMLASWDGAQWQATTLFLNPQAPAVSPDGTLLAAAYGFPDRDASLYDLVNLQPLRNLQGAFAHYTFAFSPDGRRVAGLGLGKVGLWDVATGAPLWFTEAGRRAQILTFSPDGNWLALGESSRYDPLLLLKSATGGLQRRYLKPKHDYGSLSFSPCGRLVARSGLLFAPDVLGSAAQ